MCIHRKFCHESVGEKKFENRSIFPKVSMKHHMASFFGHSVEHANVLTLIALALSGLTRIAGASSLPPLAMTSQRNECSDWHRTATKIVDNNALLLCYSVSDRLIQQASRIHDTTQVGLHRKYLLATCHYMRYLCQANKDSYIIIIIIIKRQFSAFCRAQLC